MKLMPGRDQEPEEVVRVPLEEPWLLAGEDRLWLISSDAVSFYRDGELSAVPVEESLGDIARPFLLGGRPAVLEAAPAGHSLRVFEDGAWSRIAVFHLAPGARIGPAAESLRVVPVGEELHFFLHFGASVFHRRGIPAPADEVWESWVPVATAGRAWTAVALGGVPALFRVAGTPGESQLIGLKPGEERWERFFRHTIGFAYAIGVLPLDGASDFVLFYEFFPGSVCTVEARNGDVVREVRHGPDFPFSGATMGVVFLPHLANMLAPLLLALILSVLMRKYRVREYAVEAEQAAYASLFRRGCAQMVDAVILVAPLVVGFVTMFSCFGGIAHEGPRSGCLVGLATIPLGLLWAVGCLVAFAYTEGRFGRTPGKWLLGIRVLGTDLRPCGFGRALIRNLLKFVDGFFNFMVGVLVAALTEHWQRVGDLAARTVVVRDVRRGDDRYDRSAPGDGEAGGSVVST